MTDPFDRLAVPAEPRRPRIEFTRTLRARLEAELGLAPAGPSEPDHQIPTISLASRRNPMSSPTTADTEPLSSPGDRAVVASAVTPYLAASDAAAALDFYRRAFGAIENHRVVGPDGTIGHAEFTIGDARFYLSDAFPGMGVHSPADLEGTTVTLHLEVSDADECYARAVEAGATGLAEPADQPHGSRHGTLVDPYGHRWMLSQTLTALDSDRYRDEMAASGWTVTPGPDAAAVSAVGADEGGAGEGNGHIWASVNAADAPAMIRFMVDVLGFTEQIVVPDVEPGTVAHSQLRWPEGGVIQVASANRPGNVFSQRPTGGDNLYVITADPGVVLERCRAAAVEIVAEPQSPDYDPGGTVFSIRDTEGNLWSFGTYSGEA